MAQNPPIALMLLPLPLVVGTVVGLIVGFASGSLVWGIVAFVVAALALAAVAFLAADRMALSLLNARPLAHGASVMLRNQLEELCARTGVAEPKLYTVGPGAPAIASVGRKEPALVVTDGLSEDLTVVELEAAVAREIARTRSGATTIDTLAVPFITVPLAPLHGFAQRALRFFRGGDHDARCDLDGIAITRYPPGMTAAIEKMLAAPSPGSRLVQHLWATGLRDGQDVIGAYGVEDRLELLREL